MSTYSNLAWVAPVPISSPRRRALRVSSQRSNRAPTACEAHSRTWTRRHCLAAAAGALFAKTTGLTEHAVNAAEARGEGPDEAPCWMQEQFANNMETGMKEYEAGMAPSKVKLFERLRPGMRILDVGIGTGPNLAYLPENVTCIGLEPNSYMAQYAIRRASTLSGRGLSMYVVEGRGESMPFDDASFDAVISTLTLCSVSRPQQVVREIARVLRPGGDFLFIEHVAAKDPLLRFAQRVLTPAQVLLADGCHLDRDTGRTIALEGSLFDDIRIQNVKVDTGPAGFLIANQIYGYAVRGDRGIA